MKPDYDRIYADDPANDEPLRRYIPPDEGWRIEVLGTHGTFYRAACGPFATDAAALVYVQEHLPDFAGKTLRITGTCYSVRPDGLYVYREGSGYVKHEGVQS